MKQATIDLAVPLIARFEGFSPRAMWDVNAYRLGFGSDTEGPPIAGFPYGVPVSRGMTTTKERATANLRARLPEYCTRIFNQWGPGAGAKWDCLTAHQQAALLSICYNYGRLPFQPIFSDARATSNRIAALPANHSRRVAEAEFYLEPDARISEQTKTVATIGVTIAGMLGTAAGYVYHGGQGVLSAEHFVHSHASLVWIALALTTGLGGFLFGRGKGRQAASPIPLSLPPSLPLPQKGIAPMEALLAFEKVFTSITSIIPEALTSIATVKKAAQIGSPPALPGGLFQTVDAVIAAEPEIEAFLRALGVVIPPVAIVASDLDAAMPVIRAIVGALEASLGAAQAAGVVSVSPLTGKVSRG